MIHKATIKAAGNWYAEKSIAAVEARARLILDARADALSASQFALLLWPKASAEEQKLVGRALYNVRKLESFTPYWRKSATRSTPFRDAQGQRIAAIEYLGQSF